MCVYGVHENYANKNSGSSDLVVFSPCIYFHMANLKYPKSWYEQVWKNEMELKSIFNFNVQSGRCCFLHTFLEPLWYLYIMYVCSVFVERFQHQLAGILLNNDDITTRRFFKPCRTGISRCIALRPWALQGDWNKHKQMRRLCRKIYAWKVSVSCWLKVSCMSWKSHCRRRAISWCSQIRRWSVCRGRWPTGSRRSGEKSASMLRNDYPLVI